MINDCILIADMSLDMYDAIKHEGEVMMHASIGVHVHYHVLNARNSSFCHALNKISNCLNEVGWEFDLAAERMAMLMRTMTRIVHRANTQYKLVLSISDN